MMTATPEQQARLNILGQDLLDIEYEMAQFEPTAREAAQIAKSGGPSRNTIEDLGGIGAVLDLVQKGLELKARYDSARQKYVAARQMVEG